MHTPVMEKFIDALTSCRKCPRLVEHRETYPDTYWRRPVPPNGNPRSKIVLVGLAPAGHGGNRTGRMFTGDRSANNLTYALHQVGLSNKPTSESRDDGLRLEVYLTSAVKCVPPGNKPTAEEIGRCLHYLEEEVKFLKEAKVYVALGGIAWNSLLEVFSRLGYSFPKQKFRHGAEVLLRGDRDVWLLASYHPSPRNMNTGRLTMEMLVDVLMRAKQLSA